MTSLVSATAPTWTTVPSNLSIAYHQTISSNFVATDTVAIDRYFINDTTRFNISFSGELKNLTTLGVGAYYLNVSVNNTANLVNSSSFSVTITPKNAGLSLYFNGTQGNKTVESLINHDFNITGVVNDGVGNISLYQNLSLLQQNESSLTEIVSLTQGVYNFTLLLPATENYSMGRINYYIFVVSLLPPKNFTVYDYYLNWVKLKWN